MTDESISYLDALKEIKRLKEAWEKVKEEIKGIAENPDYMPIGTYDYVRGSEDCRKVILEIIDKHISELRGEEDGQK